MEKQRRIKVLSLCAAIIAVIGLTVAFATLSTTLSVNGTSYLDAAKWGIKFQNLSEPSIVGEASDAKTAKIEKDVSIKDIKVTLSKPGDSVTYTVDLVNEGDINAKIENIEKTNLTEEQQKYITFTVKYKENDTELKIGDILSKGEVKPLVIKIEYRKDLESSDLPKSAQEINLSYKLDFVQTDDKAETTSGISKACTTFEKKDTYSVGDVIALCNNDTKVSEDFYVISDNGSTVTALAKYNINPTSNVQSDDYSYFRFADYNETKRKENWSNPSGASYGYWTDDTSNHNLLSKYGTSYPANVFDSNSNLYEPLENYKTYLKNTLGKTSIEASLITYEELLNLGCTVDGDGAENGCKSAPSWVYSTCYWTVSAFDDTLIWQIIGTGDSTSMYIIAMYFDGPILAGLRPVITISKSEL